MDLFGLDLAQTKVKLKRQDSCLTNSVEKLRLSLSSKREARMEHFGVQ
jgi:hypothetical protein